MRNRSKELLLLLSGKKELLKKIGLIPLWIQPISLLCGYQT